MPNRVPKSASVMPKRNCPATAEAKRRRGEGPDTGAHDRTAAEGRWRLAVRQGRYALIPASGSRRKAEAPGRVDTSSFVRFPLRGRGKLDDVSIGIRAKTRSQIGQTGGAAVADRGTQVAHHVREHRTRRTRERHTDLGAFRPERLKVH